MIYLIAIAMGLVAQISYRVVLSTKRVGHGFGSPSAEIWASFGAGSFILCTIPTTIFVGISKGFLVGLGFLGASFIGNFMSGFVGNMLGFYGQRFLALLGLPINIGLAISALVLV